MILIVLAVIALFLFGKGSASVSVSGDGVPGAGVTPLPTPSSIPPTSAVAQTPVINNATGGSLSSALGTAAATPGYYATGNPGYTTQTRPIAPTPVTPRIDRSGAPIERPEHIALVAPPTRTRIARGRVNVPRKTSVNPTGTFNPAIAARPVVVERVGPEVASAPWSKAARPGIRWFSA